MKDHKHVAVLLIGFQQEINDICWAIIESYPKGHVLHKSALKLFDSNPLRNTREYLREILISESKDVRTANEIYFPSGMELKILCQDPIYSGIARKIKEDRREKKKISLCSKKPGLPDKVLLNFIHSLSMLRCQTVDCGFGAGSLYKSEPILESISTHRQTINELVKTISSEITGHNTINEVA